jgi:hypothetical protein
LRRRVFMALLARGVVPGPLRPSAEEDLPAGCEPTPVVGLDLGGDGGRQAAALTVERVAALEDRVVTLLGVDDTALGRGHGVAAAVTHAGASGFLHDRASPHPPAAAPEGPEALLGPAQHATGRLPAGEDVPVLGEQPQSLLTAAGLGVDALWGQSAPGEPVGVPAARRALGGEQAVATATW